MPTEEDPHELIAALEAERDELKDKWQRALAELENTRRRLEQDAAQRAKYANEALILDILPTVDNFYRATEHVPADLAQAPWVTGIQYIQKQLIETLAQYGVAELVPAAGAILDPSQHEAVSTEDSAELEQGAIVRVLQRGYTLNDRVVRPVQVVVNQKAE